MNEKDHISANTIHVLSTKGSNNPLTGSITTNGGIGVSKNIQVGGEVVTKQIIVEKSGTFGHNLFVKGDLSASNQFINDPNDKLNLIFKKSIIPENTSYVLGSSNNRWRDIFSRNIDCKSIKTNKIVSLDLDLPREAKFGTNSDRKPILKVSPDKKDTVCLDGILSMKSQKVEADKDSLVKITKSLVLLYNRSGNDLKLELDGETLSNDSLVRVVLKTDNGVLLIVNGDECIDLPSKNRYVELLWTGCDFIFIGGNIPI